MVGFRIFDVGLLVVWLVFGTITVGNTESFLRASRPTAADIILDTHLDGRIASLWDTEFFTPQNPMPRVIVTADGQVKYSSLQMDAGSQPQSTTLGYRDAITELLYYLEVPRDLHSCRHVDATTCR